MTSKGRGRRTRDGWIIWWTTLALYVSVALVLVFGIQLYQRDAMARTVHALMVLFGAEPKLANIGFLWPPLPVLLQLPLVLIPPLRYRGLAGNVVTALAGAGSAVCLNALLKRMGIRSVVRYILVAVFFLNPMILLYSSNGKSEIISVFLFLLLFYSYMRWVEVDSWEHLAAMGVAGALSFLTRYEAAFFLLVFLVFIAHDLWRKRKNLTHIWAAWLLYGVPVAYAVGVWVATNWSIMGHPLYFAIGPYSSGRFALIEMKIRPWLVGVRSDMGLAAQVAIRRTAQFFPAFFLVSILLVAQAVRGRARELIYLLLPAVFVFNAIINYLWGFPLVYMRYYLLTIPISYILAALFLAHRRSSLLWGLTVAAMMLFSAPFTAQMMYEQTSTIGEHYFIRRMLGHNLAAPYPAERQMAAYITEHVSERNVLADTAAGSDVIFFTGKPALFVLPGDSDFYDVLDAPYGQVEYILVPESPDASVVNQIVKAHPALQHANDVGWAQLAFRSEGWRLYRVISSPGAST